MVRILACVVLLAGALAAPAAAADAPKNPDVAAVVQGDTQFALELYARLRGREGNLFFSPYSISTALAMTYAGARGETAEQMAKTLHFTLPGEKLHPAMGVLIRQINDTENPKRGYQLSTANALWGQKGFDFREPFLALNRKDYGAALKEVDFARATEQARKEINAWVEKETHDKIKELLKPGVLDPDTLLVLTNAIYFKGKWNSEFKKDLTKDAPFTTAAGGKVNVPLMRQQGDFRYAETPELQALELPYVGKELSMLVLLPKKIDGLPALEKALTPESLTRWLGQLRQQEVTVFLPRFKTTAEFELNRTLSAMGMPLAFSQTADFSGMTEKRSLYLSNVVHKAFVDVNEEGTEAAAATGVIVGPTAVRITPVFRADHPFVYMIRDNRSGSVLFLGRLAEPK
jgi:serpin B